MSRAAAAALLALALAACSSNRAAASRATAPAAAPLPPGWGRIEPLLRAGERAYASGDQSALAALVPAVEREGLALLKANVPNLLARHDVPRFLEGRAAFGDALVELAQAREQGRTADLAPALLRVADAFRGWMAVVRGGPPDRAL